MRKPTRFDQQLAALRGSPTAEDIRAALRSKNGFLIAAAVPHANAPDLAEAFMTLVPDGAKRDPICRGKVAIARALHDRDEWSDIYLTGVSCVQMEGGVDTAGELRGICGLAHARFGRPNALDVIADLLADPLTPVRVAAAQALGDAGRPDGSALLRYKLRIGDPDGEVIGAAAGALLHLQRGDALPFLTELMVPPHEDAIALALAESRLPDALPPLRAWVARSRADTRRAIGYLALALTRAANDDLLAVIRDGDAPDALAAAKALATFRDDPAVRDAVLAVAPRALRSQIAALLA